MKILTGLTPSASLGDLRVSESYSYENDAPDIFYSVRSSLLICQSGLQRKENTQRQKPAATN
jgi:hypothetical protein